MLQTPSFLKITFQFTIIYIILLRRLILWTNSFLGHWILNCVVYIVKLRNQYKVELINLNFANIFYSTPSKFKSDNIVAQRTNTLVTGCLYGCFQSNQNSRIRDTRCARLRSIGIQLTSKLVSLSVQPPWTIPRCLRAHTMPLCSSESNNCALSTFSGSVRVE